MPCFGSARTKKTGKRKCRKFNRRQVTALLGGGLLAPLAAPSIVRARSTQPIFIVVPYASGGTIDNIIRTVAKSMSETLQRPVLVDNKPGGNGIVGSQYVARAPKDGTVLLAGGTGPISLNVMLRKNLPYKLEDFASVAMLFTGPLTLTVNAEKMPVKDVKSSSLTRRAAPNRCSTPHWAPAASRTSTGSSCRDRWVLR